MAAAPPDEANRELRAEMKVGQRAGPRVERRAGLRTDRNVSAASGNERADQAVAAAIVSVTENENANANVIERGNEIETTGHGAIPRGIANESSPASLLKSRLMDALPSRDLRSHQHDLHHQQGYWTGCPWLCKRLGSARISCSCFKA